MKKHSNTLFNQLGKEQVKSLTSFVKETLAIDHTFPVKKNFTAAELWNIQRQKRVALQRRLIF